MIGYIETDHRCLNNINDYKGKSFLWGSRVVKLTGFLASKSQKVSYKSRGLFKKKEKQVREVTLFKGFTMNYVCSLGKVREGFIRMGGTWKEDSIERVEQVKRAIEDYETFKKNQKIIENS